MTPGLLLAARLLALGPGCVPHTDAATLHQLDAEVRAGRQRVQLLEARLADCPEPAGLEPLHTELLQVFGGTEVRVSREGGLPVLRIPADVLFAAGETSLRGEAAMVVDLLATALDRYADAPVLLVGHTDDAPLHGRAIEAYGDQRGLSLAMADALADALTLRHGVAAARFTVAGRGAAAPLAANDTPEARAQNRRVVVVLGASPPPG